MLTIVKYILIIPTFHISIKIKSYLMEELIDGGRLQKYQAQFSPIIQDLRSEYP